MYLSYIHEVAVAEVEVEVGVKMEVCPLLKHANRIQ